MYKSHMLYQNLRSKDFFSKFSMDLLLAEDVVFSIDMHPDHQG